VRVDAEYLLATAGAQQELVLLHGWGSNREIWRPMLAALRPWANITLLDLPGCAPGYADASEIELQELLAAVLAATPQQAIYIGWSLGGQVALELAARHADRVSALITVCSNPHFVAENDWPGMELAAFARFQEAYHAAPAAGLRRFASLQAQGAERPRELLRQIASQQQYTPGLELLPGLGWLRELDQRALLLGLKQPQLHLLAEKDALVPLRLERSLAELLPEQSAAQVQIVPAASHLAPLDRPLQLVSLAREFLDAAGLLRVPVKRDEAPAKEDVSSSFSRAAESYDSVAKLQREVGKRLLTHLDVVPAAPDRILDLGCGTGFFQPDLSARYREAIYIGLDLAPGMIEYARTRASGPALWVVGDAESLPLATASIDVVFSSLAVQWCHKPEWFLAELARVLKPGGRCVFTTLGPDTLRELRQAWAAVDSYQHVNNFLPSEALIAAGERVAGIELTLSTERHCMQYQRVGDLLAELKSLGAHNMNRRRPAGLTSRKTLQGMLQAYESWRVDGLLPATYDVIFGQVTKI
jgi:malonyl-CoA O-methyltransferase